MGLAELLADSSSSAGAAEGAVLGADAPPAPAAAKPEELGVEADEGGQAKSIPYPRFKEVNTAYKATKAELEKERAERKAEAEKYAKTAERVKRFEARYGKFDKPEDQMEEDATVAEAMWALKNKPEIQAALRLIQQHSQGAKVSDRTEKPVEAPAADPRVEQLVTERTRDVARGILSDAKVREQLHGPILDYVLSQKDLKPTREAIRTAMREYIGAQGWTNQFLRGDGKPAKPAIVPNPGSLNGGTAKPKEGEAKSDKPKNLTGLQQESRSKFRNLWNERMTS